MQYTIRNIPALLDKMLRRRARESGASLNDAALQALAAGIGLTGERIKRRELRDLAGKWRHDPETEQAIRDQDVIDESIWK